jgi:hypothetical protein
MNKPKPMKAAKPSRRKSPKLAPIDWHEYANDAVLNGNMSTLFHRPPTEDPSAYASPEALVEIGKRTKLTPEAPKPVGGGKPTVVMLPTVTEGPGPAVGTEKLRRAKPIRKLQDALTLAGQVLYQAMYGTAEAGEPVECAKGYRQLAAETHLDKDTVRDLIADFKAKGMVREIGGYNPDTRSPKTYEVLSGQAILKMWRDAGLEFVTSGRQRPEFCNAQGQIYR